jgi:hypothetical protein
MKTFKLTVYLLVLVHISLLAQGIKIGSGTTFTGGSATIFLSGNWSNSGTFTAGTGTVIFNGTSENQTITKSGGERFYNLTVKKSSGDVQLSDNVSVSETVTLTSGDLDLNGKTLSLGAAGTLNETAGNTVTGATGMITTTRNLNSPTGDNVGGLGAMLTTSANLGSTTIERSHSPGTGAGNQGILRVYNIVPTNNSGLDATLRQYYDESELNGATEVNLVMFKSATGTKNSWSPMGGTVNTTDNYVERSGLNDFSFWTLGDSNGIATFIDQIEVEVVPAEFSLYQNYPNPFNPSTKIRYQLPQESKVIIKIYDILGSEVITLLNEKKEPGVYEVDFNVAHLPSGTYFYRIVADGFIETKKMILMK